MICLGYITGIETNEKITVYIPNKYIRNYLHYIFIKLLK